MSDSTTVVAALDSLVKYTTVGDVGRVFDVVARTLVVAFILVIAAQFAFMAWAWNMANRGAK